MAVSSGNCKAKPERSTVCHMKIDKNYRCSRMKLRVSKSGNVTDPNKIKNKNKKKQKFTQFQKLSIFYLAINMRAKTTDYALLEIDLDADSTINNSKPKILFQGSQCITLKKRKPANASYSTMK